jgi:ParB-like chromosome segregation protein Spo0J
MKPHPAAAVFPALEGDELEAMIQDIAQNGQLEPIVEHEGMILDGNSRFTACMALALEPKIKPWTGEGGSPAAFVISQNIRRRHLKPSQRAWLISELTTFKRGDVSVQRSQKAEEKTDGVMAPSLTAAEAAVIAGVESTTVKNAKLVRERGSTKETVRLVGEAISAGINATMPEVLADAAAPAGSRTLHADSLGSTPEAKPPQRHPRGLPWVAVDSLRKEAPAYPMGCANRWSSPTSRAKRPTSRQNP